MSTKPTSVILSMVQKGLDKIEEEWKKDKRSLESQIRIVEKEITLSDGRVVIAKVKMCPVAAASSVIPMPDTHSFTFGSLNAGRKD